MRVQEFQKYIDWENLTWPENRCISHRSIGRLVQRSRRFSPTTWTWNHPNKPEIPLEKLTIKDLMPTKSEADLLHKQFVGLRAGWDTAIQHLLRDVMDIASVVMPAL